MEQSNGAVAVTECGSVVVFAEMDELSSASSLTMDERWITRELYGDVSKRIRRKSIPSN